MIYNNELITLLGETAKIYASIEAEAKKASKKNKLQLIAAINEGMKKGTLKISFTSTDLAESGTTWQTAWSWASPSGLVNKEESHTGNGRGCFWVSDYSDSIRIKRLIEDVLASISESTEGVECTLSINDKTFEL